jgi:hypothetical protein
MYSTAVKRAAVAVENRSFFIPAPSQGLRFDQPRAGMDPRAAGLLDNWLDYPDRIEMRRGAANHVTGFAEPVQGLWTWAGPTGSELFATCDDGIFDATSAGAVGAAVAAITNGLTQGVNINTGANSYLVLVNATDDLWHYEGTVWTQVAAFGALNTDTISAVEVYKQRLFFIERNSMTLWYLPINSIAGAATSFPLGAIFRRGGKLAAIATWTVDSGTGPDDLFVVASTEGEVAVFSGSDPSTLATWAYRGVYALGRPLGGARSLFKNGGDLLFLCENGIFPLAKALQSASIEKQIALTDRIQALFSSYARNAPTSDYWGIVAQPDIPAIIVNVPGVPEGRQLVMNTQSKGWNTFSGLVANCWARVGAELYYGSDTAVVHALTGSGDFGGNVTATTLLAYNNLSFPRNKQIAEIMPILRASGPFDYTIGVDNDFANDPASTLVANPLTALSLWGTALWGTGTWSGPATVASWQSVPDTYGRYKAIYLQVTSKTVQPALEGFNALYTPGGNF